VRTPAALVLACALASTLAACGAKTGLRVVPRDASLPDSGYVPPHCLPYRVHVPVGTGAALRAEVDAPTPRTGRYLWSLRSGPPGTRATVSPGAGDAASITPDVAGTYEIEAATPYAGEDGGALVCPVVVEAEAPDSRCPMDPVVEPRRVEIPEGTLQVAFDPAFGAVRSASDPTAGTALLAADAPAEDVAAAVMDLPANDTLEMFATQLEARIAGVLGGAPVLLGRGGATPDGVPLRRSSFRVTTALDATADVARDRVVRDVLQLSPGAPRLGFRPARDFVYEVVTSVRAAERRATVLFAVAPEARFNDPNGATAIRLRDVTNATGLARRERALAFGCQAFVATRTLTADFLWLIDTSSSMDDDQERLGNTAEGFFREMNTAGVDFRVGVVQAGGIGPVDLDSPGFAWIPGSAPDGPRRLAFEVTHRRWRNDARDRLAPYPLPGEAEEPVAAGVLTVTEMERRVTTDRDDARRFRARATRVVFFASDERGTNDDMRFFARDPAHWGATPDARVQRAAQWFRDRGFLTFGLADVFETRRCPNVVNFVPCLTTLNGGAYIPLSTATDAEVSAAFSRIVDAIAGASSEFVLTRLALSSTLRVRLEDRPVPRSRASGFDTDEGGRTLLFRGAMYQPRAGQTVRAAFFAWE
jgi:hypothetical protein